MQIAPASIMAMPPSRSHLPSGIAIFVHYSNIVLNTVRSVLTSTASSELRRPRTREWSRDHQGNVSHPAECNWNDEDIQEFLEYGRIEPFMADEVD